MAGAGTGAIETTTEAGVVVMGDGGLRGVEPEEAVPLCTAACECSASGEDRPSDSGAVFTSADADAGGALLSTVAAALELVRDDTGGVGATDAAAATAKAAANWNVL